MPSVVTLERAPSLGRLYLQAVVTARLGGGGALPDVELVLADTVPDPEQLAAYVRVCGGMLRDRLPAAYPHVLAFPLQVRLMADRAFPLPLPGLVHLRNTITQHRPIGTAEPLSVRVHAEGLSTHPRGALVDLVASADVAGEEVWTSRSTYLARGARVTGGAPAPDLEVSLPRTPTAVWRVPGDIGRRYAAVSGDVNPIHLHPLTARAFGFPRAIAHGMWCKAHALAALESRLPDAFTVDVAFRKPVLLPSTAHFVVRPTGGGFDLGLLRAGKDGEHLVGTVR
ncbi:MAG TPA: MaoC/PaaZ C-terminal domain-containing protein [Mycobacteriales bacterium]|jgi:acyl dehydratase